ncbi:MAG TPA: PDZ domain-containing protein, partial [Chthonomonadales bacterium]|nr:PDZ domain-containing protein [Chthonomonadales bacterium]
DSGSAITGEALAKTTFEEAEGDAPAEIEQIVDLRLGDTGRSAEMRNPAVLSTDLSQISRLLHRKIDGIIGIPYLAGFVTEIDYDRKLLIFHDPRHFNLTNRTPQAGRSYLIKLGVLSANNPVSKVTITGGLPGGQNLSFLLDTGFGGYVLVPHDAAIQSGLLTGDTPAIATVDYSLSHQFRSQKIVAQGLSIGQIDLSGKVVQVDYRSREADGALGIIGNRLLQNYHVVLDYPHKLLWLERTNTAEEPDDAARPSLGIILDDHSSDVRVESVSENSPARRAGIRPGDTILSINGISTSDMTVDKAASLLRQLSGLVHMELRRGVDPNLGIRGGLLFLSLRPTSPFQWLSQ